MGFAVPELMISAIGKFIVDAWEPYGYRAHVWGGVAFIDGVVEVVIFVV